MSKLMTSLIAAATVGLFSATVFAADAAPTTDKIEVTTHKTVRHTKHHVRHAKRHVHHQARHIAHKTHAAGDEMAK